MVCDSTKPGIVLKPFRKAHFPGLLIDAQTDPDVHDEFLFWGATDFPPTVKKLSRVAGFDERTADTYASGYYRGLRDAAREIVLMNGLYQEAKARALKRKASAARRNAKIGAK